MHAIGFALALPSACNKGSQLTDSGIDVARTLASNEEADKGPEPPRNYQRGVAQPMQHRASCQEAW